MDLKPCHHLFREIFVEIRYSLYPLVVILNIIFFIRTVKIVTIQTETHKNNFYPKFVFKNRADWNTPAAPNWDRGFTKSRFYSP